MKYYRQRDIDWQGIVKSAGDFAQGDLPSSSWIYIWLASGRFVMGKWLGYQDGATKQILSFLQL